MDINVTLLWTQTEPFLPKCQTVVWGHLVSVKQMVISWQSCLLFSEQAPGDRESAPWSSPAPWLTLDETFLLGFMQLTSCNAGVCSALSCQVFPYWEKWVYGVIQHHSCTQCCWGHRLSNQVSKPLKSNHGLPFLLHGWRLCSVRTDLWFKINSWKIINFYRKEECYLKKVSEGLIHQEKRFPKHYVFGITPITSAIKLIPRGLWTCMMRGSNFLWIISSYQELLKTTHLSDTYSWTEEKTVQSPLHSLRGHSWMVGELLQELKRESSLHLWKLIW